jgi:hypothetical protein
VRIEVKVDRSVSWNEVTRLTDVSAFGCGFMLKRPVKRGRMVMLTIPMPRQLRCYDYSEPQYKIWGLIRRCIQVEKRNGETSYSVGAAFIGKAPPVGYIENPARLYDIAHAGDEGLWRITQADLKKDDSDLPAELRRQSRFHIPEGLIIEQMDENGEVTASETTVTENISIGGAAVFTQFDIEPGAFLRVTSQRHDIKIISVVRGKRLGSDGMTRLHIEFIDRNYPLDGIE